MHVSKKRKKLFGLYGEPRRRGYAVITIFAVA